VGEIAVEVLGSCLARSPRHMASANRRAAGNRAPPSRAGRKRLAEQRGARCGARAQDEPPGNRITAIGRARAPFAGLVAARAPPGRSRGGGRGLTNLDAAPPATRIRRFNQTRSRVERVRIASARPGPRRESAPAGLPNPRAARPPARAKKECPASRDKTGSGSVHGPYSHAQNLPGAPPGTPRAWASRPSPFHR